MQKDLVAYVLSYEICPNGENIIHAFDDSPQSSCVLSLWVISHASRAVPAETLPDWEDEDSRGLLPPIDEEAVLSASESRDSLRRSNELMPGILNGDNPLLLLEACEFHDHISKEEQQHCRPELNDEIFNVGDETSSDKASSGEEMEKNELDTTKN